MLKYARLTPALLLILQSTRGEEAQDNDRVLRGLPGVHVVIEQLNLPAKNGGLSENLLHRQVAARLNAAGIRLLNRNEVSETRGYPILGVTVTVVPIEAKLGNTTLGYAYSVDVTLDETVYLERFLAAEEQERTFATVWQVSAMGTADVGNLPIVAPRSVAEKVDDFCRAFRAANQKAVGVGDKDVRGSRREE